MATRLSRRALPVALLAGGLAGCATVSSATPAGSLAGEGQPPTAEPRHEQARSLATLVRIAAHVVIASASDEIGLENVAGSLERDLAPHATLLLGRIYRLNRERNLKGSLADPFRLVQVEGRLDFPRRSSSLPLRAEQADAAVVATASAWLNVPRLVPGARYLLFLRPVPAGVPADVTGVAHPWRFRLPADGPAYADSLPGGERLPPTSAFHPRPEAVLLNDVAALIGGAAGRHWPSSARA